MRKRRRSDGTRTTPEWVGPPSSESSPGAGDGERPAPGETRPPKRPRRTDRNADPWIAEFDLSYVAEQSATPSSRSLSVAGGAEGGRATPTPPAVGVSGGTELRAWGDAFEFSFAPQARVPGASVGVAEIPPVATGGPPEDDLQEYRVTNFELMTAIGDGWCLYSSLSPDFNVELAGQTCDTSKGKKAANAIVRRLRNTYTTNADVRSQYISLVTANIDKPPNNWELFYLVPDDLDAGKVVQGVRLMVRQRKKETPAAYEKRTKERANTLLENIVQSTDGRIPPLGYSIDPLDAMILMLTPIAGGPAMWPDLRMPGLMPVIRDYKQRNIVVLSVQHDENDKELDVFRKEDDLSYYYENKDTGPPIYLRFNRGHFDLLRRKNGGG